MNEVEKTALLNLMAHNTKQYLIKRNILKG